MKRPIALAAIAAVGLLLSGCSLQAPNPGPTPSASSSAETGKAADIQVGDCLNDAEMSGVVTSAPIVPCDEPHDNEAFFEFDLEDGPYPGKDAITAQGDVQCVAAFLGFIGIPYNESKLSYSFYFPTENSWSEGDRRILCAVGDTTSQTTGTLKGAAR